MYVITLTAMLQFVNNPEIDALDIRVRIVTKPEAILTTEIPEGFDSFQGRRACVPT
jgi:hypothetical protein